MSAPQISPDVKRSFDLAKRLRQPWEARWQRLNDLAMPYRTSFFSVGTSRNGVPTGTIYDETGAVAVSEFANRLQSGIVPMGLQWARLEWVRDATGAEKQRLAEVQDYLFRSIERSNFEPEMTDTFKDLAGYGVCCIKIEGGDWREPLNFQAIPLSDLWLTPGPGGRTGDKHVRYRLPAHVVRAQWPNADLPPDFGKNSQGENVDVIESWLLDMSQTLEAWRWEVHVGEKLLASGEAAGQGSCPYVVGRWEKAAGEIYAVGQGMQALPAMEVVNEAVRLILANAEMALSGMWQAEDDGVTNPYAIELIPGTIVPIAPGSRGLQPLQFPGTKLDLGGLVLDQQRQAIRKALYNEQLGPRQGTPPTAFEVSERLAELARQIGPSYGRVWQEMVVPMLARILRVLKQDGRISLPILDGRKLRVVATSALVRSAASQEMRRVNEWMGMLAGLYGPTAVGQVVPLERYVELSANKYDIPANLPFTPDEMRENAAKLGQLMGETANQAAGGNPAAQALLSQFGGEATRKR